MLWRIHTIIWLSNYWLFCITIHFQQGKSYVSYYTGHIAYYIIYCAVLNINMYCILHCVYNKINSFKLKFTKSINMSGYHGVIIFLCTLFQCESHQNFSWFWALQEAAAPFRSQEWHSRPQPSMLSAGLASLEISMACRKPLCWGFWVSKTLALSNILKTQSISEFNLSMYAS